MGVGCGFYMYHVVVKRSRSLSHLLMSSCLKNKKQFLWQQFSRLTLYIVYIVLPCVAAVVSRPAGQM